MEGAAKARRIVLHFRMNLQQTIGRLSERYQIGAEAVEALAQAMQHSGGRLAQFNHPDLGGYGQWMPGMTQIGDMFNETLKAKVRAALADLSAGLVRDGDVLPGPAAAPRPAAPWWPADLGMPAAAGGQNGMDYACFPDRHRLALRRNGGAAVLYDTGGKRLTGVAQAQGGVQSLTLTGPDGPVDLRDLTPLA